MKQSSDFKPIELTYQGMFNRLTTNVQLASRTDPLRLDQFTMKHSFDFKLIELAYRGIIVLERVSLFSSSVFINTSNKE